MKLNWIRKPDKILKSIIKSSLLCSVCHRCNKTKNKTDPLEWIEMTRLMHCSVSNPPTAEKVGGPPLQRHTGCSYSQNSSKLGATWVLLTRPNIKLQYLLGEFTLHWLKRHFWNVFGKYITWTNSAKEELWGKWVLGTHEVEEKYFHFEGFFVFFGFVNQKTNKQKTGAPERKESRQEDEYTPQDLGFGHWSQWWVWNMKVSWVSSLGFFVKQWHIVSTYARTVTCVWSAGSLKMIVEWGVV